MMLAHTYTPDVDPAGWIMTEKLDGVRAYWDGKTLKTRLGNALKAPQWFLDRLPADVHLDGELWCGRGLFQKTVSIVRSHDSPDWAEVRYMVFDAPLAPGGYEARLLYAACLKGVDVVSSWVCASKDHLVSTMKRIVSEGGEGIMMRPPDSPYEDKRSRFLLKVKPFHDEEAEVTGHVPGEGKHAGRLGALTARTADGKVFGIGTGFTDAEREAPPAVGSMVTYRYQELTKDGIPRFPVFIRVRDEV